MHIYTYICIYTHVCVYEPERKYVYGVDSIKIENRLVRREVKKNHI